LGGDWNPDDPQGFEMYPLALDLVRNSLADLKKRNIPFQLEGFMWHQGENDMFNEQYMADYGKNLANFIASWRRDLAKPDLKFYIGELCTKTIWGMDLRPRMYAISQGQKAVTAADPLADYIPTSHVGVEIGGGVGLHYHYGTLGQLQHGENYADAYLRTIGIEPRKPRPLTRWPYAPGSPVRLFVLAGHRNMEGERAFTQQLTGSNKNLKNAGPSIAFRYSLGGGVYQSDGWEPLGPSGLYDNFGPELSFARTLRKGLRDNIAIAKFTHSGTQMNDWTPEGSMAETRHLYPAFIDFIKTSVDQLQAKGHRVELAGIFYHIGENDMSMPPYREKSPQWLASTIGASRNDLGRPGLKWFISQQPPTDDERVNKIEVTSRFAELASSDPHTTHIKAFDLPAQPKKLVLDTPAILRLGEVIADAYLTR
ncbi:MAG: sialate O-acetylesterase, partial [Verrucomicrobiales bacterium]|nr:sialate O-acetylesterase [Verrucomicrobiales bacterium]